MLSRRSFRQFRRLLRRFAAEISSAILTLVFVVAGVYAFRALPADAKFADYFGIVQTVLLALGLLSVVLLILQLRQTAAWNRVLSYHEYFGELPSTEKVSALYACLNRLGLPPPSSGEPLSGLQASVIWTDQGVTLANGEIVQLARRVLVDYLNDFEEFCGAINAGVVSEPYARELEGSRTINAYFGFEECIKLIRDEEIHRRKPPDNLLAAGQQSPVEMRRKPYHELRKVAVLWKRRREKEYAKLLKKAEGFKARREDEDLDDGVPPEI